MSLEELNKAFQRSMGMYDVSAAARNAHAALQKSMGVSNVLTDLGNVSAILKSHADFSQKMTGMNAMVSAVGKHKAIWRLASTNWIAQNSALQQMALPNNVFSLGQGYSRELAKSLSPELGQDKLMKALTEGITSLLNDSGIGKVLTTQNAILNRLVKLGPLGVHPSQYRNVFNSLGTLSASMASNGLSSSLPLAPRSYLEDVVNQAEEITNSIVDHQQIGVAELNSIYNLINDLSDKIKSIDKSEFKTFGFWLSLLGIFLAIYPLVQQKIDSLDINATPATRQQVVDLRNKLIAAYHDNINVYSPTRLVNRKCKLFLKPRLKSHRLIIVLPNEKLSVINSKGKWVLVTCLDKDSLPVTGWLLKKYLTKPKVH